MSLFCRFLVVSVVVGVSSNVSTGHVVIDNFNAGSRGFATSDTGVQAGEKRATGTVQDEFNGALGVGIPFKFATGRSDEDRTGSNRRSADTALLRYSGRNGRSGQGAGGSGGGSSSGTRRSAASNGSGSGGAGIGQTLVQVGNPSGRSSSGAGSQNPTSGGLDLTLLDKGGSAGGGASSGRGSSNVIETAKSGGNPDGPVLSGTPEPAALAVWIVTGCCGYGMLRLRRKWLS